MASPYDFMMDPSASAQAEALARLMRERRRAAGTLGMLSGARTIAPVGERMLDDLNLEDQAGAKSAWLGAQERALRNRQERDAAQGAIANRSLDIKERALDAKLRAPPKAPSSRSNTSELGTYLTPASMQMTPQQRNDLMNNLAVPGAQVLDQFAELAAELDNAGDVPSPEQLANIQRLVAATTVKLNKVAGLGALSGPDLDLLQKAGGSVSELRDLVSQGAGLRDLKLSVRSAAERVAGDIVKAAGAYGSQPVPGQALDFAIWDAAKAKYLAKRKGSKSGPNRKQGRDGKWYVLTDAGWEAE